MYVCVCACVCVFMFDLGRTFDSISKLDRMVSTMRETVPV